MSAVSDSRAKPLLEELGCRVLHFGLDDCLRLDDKHAFGLWARELGLPSLDSDLEEFLEFMAMRFSPSLKKVNYHDLC